MKIFQRGAGKCYADRMPQGESFGDHASSELATQETPGSRDGGTPDRPLGLWWLFPDHTRARLDLSHRGPTRSTIGRGVECDIVLPGVEISRVHALIRRDGPLLTLADQGSRNGTWLNGRRIELCSLQAGDVVRVGEWVGLLTYGEQLESYVQAPGLIGGSVLRDSIGPALHAARSNVPVVLVGPSGTGKEVVARAIHQLSQRSGAFIGVNCAAIPEGLAEAELFGYRRGAFSGATESSRGLFGAADGGSLFLDEIGDLPLSIQAKLLRALELGEIQSIGDARPYTVDVRIVSAAQLPLEQAVENGSFRGDLYARLESIEVRLPPLVERKEDILQLFFNALGQEVGPQVTASVVEQLLLYDWPFNVREVIRVAERLRVMHAGGHQITVEQLPERVRKVVLERITALSRSSLLPDTRATSAGEAPVAELLKQTLIAADGNLAQAARRLGITRQKAYRLLSELPGFDLESIGGKTRRSKR